LPLALQYSPAAQPASFAQLVGHAAFTPSQTSGKQVGVPAEPAATGVHVPSTLAPSDFAHTSHAPLHPALQQKPSAQ
jgi:hypothetical protein